MKLPDAKIKAKFVKPSEDKGCKPERNITIVADLPTDGGDLSNYYTKSETDELLGDKADADLVYMKQETDELVKNKADKELVSAKEDKHTSVRLIAHRGSSYNAPENTLKAFEIAGKQGFYGIEFDVQKTSDEEFVIMHDRNVMRTTDGEGNIDEMTLE